MSLQPFSSVAGAAIPLLENDINTDQIIPSAFLKEMSADLGKGFFAYKRRHPDGTVNLQCVLEQPAYRAAPILVVGGNFGCGSSREHAVWAMQAFGVRCVIALSHAEFFRDNCLKNGVLAISLPAAEMADLSDLVVADQGKGSFRVDLVGQQITTPGGREFAFSISGHERLALLEGLDDVGLTLKLQDAIASWERATLQGTPFMQCSMAALTELTP